MLRYRLICSDLDDTLVNGEAVLTDGVKDAVRRYTEAGGRFCIVTGRMTAGAIPVCRELGLDTETATYQGSVVTDLATGEVVYEAVLDTELAATIADYIRGRGFYCQTYVGDVFIMEKAEHFTHIYSRISFADFRETNEPLGTTIRNKGIRPPKLLIMADPKVVPEFEEDLKREFSPLVRINTSKPFIIEIIPNNVSKAKAVQFIADRHGISMDDVICIGDSDNDIPMLEVAGLGIAVNNASTKVKGYAKAVVPSCDEDGVAYAIDNFALNND